MNVKHLQSLARYNSWRQTFLEYFARKQRKSSLLIWSCQLVGSTQYLASFQSFFSLKKKKNLFCVIHSTLSLTICAESLSLSLSFFKSTKIPKRFFLHHAPNSSSYGYFTDTWFLLCVITYIISQNKEPSLSLSLSLSLLKKRTLLRHGQHKPP